jgi:LCP family protein required for cell wall assembly
VAIPSFGEERINAAFALGGAETAKRTVGDVLGVPVQRFLLIGLQGVRDIVDAAGGVDLDVPTPIHDDAYPTDDYGTIVVDIPAGRQHMNGETALRYARTRHQDSDFGRVGRQQQVMVALRNAMLQPSNWWRAPAVLEAVRRTTQTDLGPLDLVALSLSLGANPSPERLVVGPGLVQEFTGADGAYLLRTTPALRRSVAVLLAPSQARIEVLNATQQTGLAKGAADKIAAAGYPGVTFGDAGRAQSSTSIEVRPGAAQVGRSVAALLDLPSSLVHESYDLPDSADVRVVIGDRRA